MSKMQTLMQPMVRYAVATAAALVLAACGSKEPEMPWQSVSWDEAGLEMRFPCAPEFARTPVDFGMEIGSVPVSMMGCDAVDSTFAMSQWLLDDAAQADDALAFWEVAVLSQFDAVDGDDSKSGAQFVPAGAMDLPRSIRATVEGVGRAGWTVTTHGVWFARKEGDKARIYHAVVYAPKAYHQTANTFFNSITLK
ncbi:hypothetical protein [Comamonas sp.]|uniref:hypothetical protein n=1 Tax=Comamonas sp. TaxID=34028 RepID=UPI002897FC85|nr:hypothetical protein [Comamonas sp.]